MKENQPKGAVKSAWTKGAKGQNAGKGKGKMKPPWNGKSKGKGNLLNVKELAQHIYRYDHSSGKAWHPSSDELPWPVMLLLGGHSRKHVFLSKLPPNLKTASLEAMYLARKIRWTARLGLESKAPWYKMKNKNHKIPPCNEKVPKQVLAFTQSLQRRLCVSFSSASKKQKGMGTWWSNNAAAYGYAIKWLREKSW
eukprot:2233737-Lingulodinium_polyedra.AAC.1